MASFVAEKAKSGRSGCKECKNKIDKQTTRIGKVTASAFGDEGDTMTTWFHPKCFFEAQMRSRATTNKVEDPSDLDGFYSLETDERKSIMALIDDFNKAYADKAKGKGGASPKKTGATSGSTLAAASAKDHSRTSPAKADKHQTVLTWSGKIRRDDGHAHSHHGHHYHHHHDRDHGASSAAAKGSSSVRHFSSKATSDSDEHNGSDTHTASAAGDGAHGKDYSFRAFRHMVEQVAATPGHLDKISTIRDFITSGTSGDGFTGDLYLTMKLLLPLHPKRVYNMKDKQLMKAFSSIFGANSEDMLGDVMESGDPSETVRVYHEKSKRCPPCKKSTLTVKDVDDFLNRMEGLTRFEDQVKELEAIVRRCTAHDTKVIVRLLKHDLRMNAGSKIVLDALHPRAYEAWKASNNLRQLIDRIKALDDEGADEDHSHDSGSSKPRPRKELSVRASLMTPVKPMLAEACKNLHHAFKKCPNGMYAEIKYDGERVQIHKDKDTFQFFSRSLKTVTAHKIEFFREDVKVACPHADSMILDAEVLMVDRVTGKPLPFGTLGVHKKKAFKEAQPCLFVFDVLQFNGENLMEKPFKERRKYLEKNVTQVQNKVMHAESRQLPDVTALQTLVTRVIREGLEGLVLKDAHSVYEPGKRHWLKVKKDYLDEGAMADSCDLVVLGAYFGTGSKGGMMSSFLMGCQDDKGRWRTVCKVANGFDDATLDKLNRDLRMKRIDKDAAKVPSWLMLQWRDLAPDFVSLDPLNSPVFEVTGAEFSKSTHHSADGISIRFPRVTKIRTDKDPKDATDLARLKTLAKASAEAADFSFMAKGGDDNRHSAAAATETTGLPETDVDDDDDDDDDDGGDGGDGGGGGDGGAGAGGSAGCAVSGADVSRASHHRHNHESDPSSKRGGKRRGAASDESEDDQDEPDLSTVKRRKRAKEMSLPDHKGDSTSTMALDDIFTGKSFYVPPTHSQHQRLLRYIVAYDGEVAGTVSTETMLVLESLETEAWDDHVKSAVETAGTVVLDAWIAACIRARRLVDMGTFQL